MPRPRLVIASIVLTMAAFVAWNRTNTSWGVDFAQVWLGGQLAGRHGNVLYGPDSQSIADEALRSAFDEQRSQNLLNVIRHRQGLALMQGREWLFAFTATPFLYTLFGALPADYDTALAVYRVIGLTATIAACLLLCSIAGLSPPVSLSLTAAILVLFEPLASDQRVVNVNQIQLLSLAVCMWLLSRETTRAPLLSGAVIAAAVLFKPTVVFVPLLVIAYRVIGREHARALREAAGMSIGVLAAVVSSSMFFGTPSAWSSWLGMARRLAGADIPRAAGNIAIFNATAIVTSILFATAVAILYRMERRLDDALLVPLGVLIYLLGGNLVWLHYPVLALPAALMLLSPRLPVMVRIAAAFALSLIAVRPWALFVRAYETSVQAAMIATGLVILLVLMLRECARQRVWIRRPVPAWPPRASTGRVHRSDSRRRSG